MLLIQEYFRNHPRPSANKATGSSSAKWALLLAPTQQLVRQQAERVARFTGLSTRPFFGKALRELTPAQWKQQTANVVSPSTELWVFNKSSI
jgi:ERCC4-related helicase